MTVAFFQVVFINFNRFKIKMENPVNIDINVSSFSSFVDFNNTVRWGASLGIVFLR